jgi:RNA polymerase sigma factor (sigma-70 family)
MPTETGFDELLTRVRDGDARAAEDLVRLYQAQILRVVRVRLTDPRLRQQMDTMDVCQSVLGEFFFRVTLGQFELQSPGELVALLAKMARNKLINRAKHHHAARRDVGRQIPLTDDSPSLPGPESTPSASVARADLLAACKRLLNDDERRLAEARAEGRTWDELAAEFGAAPEALRKRHARALDRVAEELGWESGDEQ